MELIRSILLYCAESNVEIIPFKNFSGLSDGKIVGAHLTLLEDAGFLSSHFRTSRISTANSVHLGWRLTWQGNEFLESVRDPEIWRSTKAGAEKIGAWSIKLLGEIAAGYVKQKAVALGLPVTM